MKYRPKNIDPITLLKRAKFFRLKNGRGWAKPQWNKNRKTPPTDETLIRRRLHARVLGDIIDFHYDMPVSKKKLHQAQSSAFGKGGKRVKKMLIEFGMLDYKEPSAHF